MMKFNIVFVFIQGEVEQIAMMKFNIVFVFIQGEVEQIAMMKFNIVFVFLHTGRGGTDSDDEV